MSSEAWASPLQNIHQEISFITQQRCPHSPFLPTWSWLKADGTKVPPSGGPAAHSLHPGKPPLSCLGSREGRPPSPALRKEVRASLYSTGPQESSSWAPPGHPCERRREQPQGAWGQWSTWSLCLPRISPISLSLFSPGASLLCRRPFLAPLPLPQGPSASAPRRPLSCQDALLIPVP